MSLSDECIIKTTWSGISTGSTEQIRGIETYIARPADGQGDASKALLYLPDIHSVGLINNKLMCDDFARAGYHTYLPDYFHGDYLTDAKTNGPGFDRAAWGAKHSVETVQKDVDAIVEALKERGVKTFAAAGYCFGAPFVINLAAAKAIQVAILTHPSRLEVPKDLLRIKESGVASIWNTCEVDKMYPPESQKEGDDVLGRGSDYFAGDKDQGAYKRTYWEGCTHGFAVRGDMNQEKTRIGKEGAFKASVEWLKEQGF